MTATVNKLRELRDEAASKMVDNPKWVCRRAEEIADEIEREIAERYMELPLDADGVPIHIGDMLEATEPNAKKERFIVAGYTTEYSTWAGDSATLMATNENATEFYCHYCRHVKPRTIEDVLRDAGVSVAAISDVAAELRELMGGE